LQIHLLQEEVSANQILYDKNKISFDLIQQELLIAQNFYEEVAGSADGWVQEGSVEFEASAKVQLLSKDVEKANANLSQSTFLLNHVSSSLNSKNAMNHKYFFAVKDIVTECVTLLTKMIEEKYSHKEIYDFFVNSESAFVLHYVISINSFDFDKTCNYHKFGPFEKYDTYFS
jgi:hypothetical protein